MEKQSNEHDVNVSTRIPGAIIFTILMTTTAACGPRTDAFAASDEAGRHVVDAARERLPRSFEERSAGNGRTQFVSRTPDSTVVLSGDEATLALGDTALHMRVVGADASARSDASDELGGRSHYLIGSDPARWQTAGARVDHDADVRLGDAGHGLRLQMGDRYVRMDTPSVYQDAADGRRIVPGRYALDGPRQVRFEIGAYDHGDRLTIDPVITYSTYFGGRGKDAALAVAVDSGGFIYLTGRTGSVDVNTFPIVKAIQPDFNAFTAAFVTKLTPDGQAIVYSTYLGGTSGNEGNAIAVDPHGSVYIAGTTNSVDFPMVNPVQTTCGGGDDAFVVKLNPAGSAFEYSTCLGGESNEEQGFGMVIDDAGNAYVTGYTRSSEFPTRHALQPVHAGEDGEFDAFLSVIRPGGSDFVYSTFLGGTDSDEGHGVAIDDRRNVYLTGRTRSTDFPVRNAFQEKLRGETDAFVMKIDRTGQQIVYSTYLGGDAPEPPDEIRGGDDMGLVIAVDRCGDATVAGRTNSTDLPTLNPAQPHLGGPQHPSRFSFTTDAFVARFDASGVPSYVTYAGGNSDDTPTAITLDDNGVAWITGTTESGDFPSVRARQPNFGDGLVFSSADGGGTWQAAAGGVGHRDVLAVAVNPIDPAVIYAGTFGGGVFKTVNGGRTWAAMNSGLANLFVQALVVDPVNPSRVFAGTDEGGVFKSVDGGANWTLSLRPLPVTTLAIAPSNPSIMYAGAAARGFGRVFTSVDGGETWNLGTATDLVEALTVDPLTPSTVYAGAPSGVWKSTDGGKTFEFHPLSNFPNGVAALAVDPMTPSTVYAGAEHGLYKSADGGVTWTFSGTGLFGTTVALAVHTSSPLTVYAGTNNGVFKTTDGANTWTPATTGITSPVVNTLTILPGDPDQLYAGTFGTTDTFVMAVRPDGTFRNSSFLGGNGEEVGGGIVIADRQRIYVSGGTSSTDFVTVDPIQPGHKGFGDAFVTVMSQ